LEEDAFAPLGVRAGAFLVLPALEVTGGYDTNPGRVPGGKSSFLTTVSPELIAKSDWTRHEVTATLRGSYTAYDKTPELDRPAFDGKVTGRLDMTRNTRTDRRGHVDRRHRQSGQPERTSRADALSDLHHARRHIRPDAALQPAST